MPNPRDRARSPGPADLFSGNTIPKRFVNVPKDQRDILDRPQSWASNVRHDPHEAPNIPGGVMAGLRAFYSRSRVPQDDTPARSTAPNTLSATPHATGRGQSDGSGSRSEAGDLDHPMDSDDQSVEAAFTSSPAPPPKRRSRSTTPNTAATPTPRLKRVKLSVPPITTFPSSGGPEEELAFEMPGAAMAPQTAVDETDAAPPPGSPLESRGLAKRARRGDTPPCGQGTQGISSTVAATPTPKPSRLMKKIDFRKKPVPAVSAPPRARLLSTVPAAIIPESSLNESTSSLDHTGPLSFRDPSPSLSVEPDLMSPPLRVTTRPVKPFSPGGSELETILRAALNTQKLQDIPVSSIETSKVEETEILMQGNALQDGLEEIGEETEDDRGRDVEMEILSLDEFSLPANVSSSQGVPEPTPREPFDMYKSAYPSFQGNLELFVKACYTLKVLRRKRALPSFLCDDFIRVFASDYVKYIASCVDDNDGNPLTAIEWYNSEVDRPVYIASVVSMEMLDAVLGAYPKETAAARYVTVNSQASSGPNINRTALASPVTAEPSYIPSTAVAAGQSQSPPSERAQSPHVTTPAILASLPTTPEIMPTPEPVLEEPRSRLKTSARQSPSKSHEKTPERILATIQAKSPKKAPEKVPEKATDETLGNHAEEKSEIVVESVPETPAVQVPKERPRRFPMPPAPLPDASSRKSMAPSSTAMSVSSVRSMDLFTESPTRQDKERKRWLAFLKQRVQKQGSSASSSEYKRKE